MNAPKPPVSSAAGFRIFVFVLCAIILATLVYSLATSAKPVSPTGWTVTFVVGTFLAAGMIFAIVWKPPSAEKAHTELMIDAPSYSEQSLVCRWSGLFGKAQIVILDETTGMIHFGNCHTPRRFLGTRERWRSCPIADVVAAHPFASKGRESLTVVTQAGNAVLDDSMENYSTLRARLEAILPPWQSGFSAEHPMMAFIHVGAGVVGVLVGGALGVWLGPRNPGDVTWLFIGAFGGALVMVALARVGVILADRYLGISIVPPLAMAGFGGAFGFMLTNWLDLAFPLGFFPPAAAAVAGFVAGIVNLKRAHSRPHEEK